MYKKHILSIVLTAALLIMPFPIHAEGIEAIYSGAISEAAARHNQMIASGEIMPDMYNRILYVLSDITGDGNPELIIQQLISKHAAEYWVYGNDGTSSYYMGEFECDADLMYGYKKGIIYIDSYKGNVVLGLAEWTANRFSNTVLYNGFNDRNGEPPTIEQLSNYYDSSRLLGRIPVFYSEGKDLFAAAETEW